jgi:hypothetical protein
MASADMDFMRYLERTDTVLQAAAAAETEPGALIRTTEVQAKLQEHPEARDAAPWIAHELATLGMVQIDHAYELSSPSFRLTAAGREAAAGDIGITLRVPMHCYLIGAEGRRFVSALASRYFRLRAGGEDEPVYVPIEAILEEMGEGWDFDDVVEMVRSLGNRGFLVTPFRGIVLTGVWPRYPAFWCAHHGAPGDE